MSRMIKSVYGPAAGAVRLALGVHALDDAFGAQPCFGSPEVVFDRALGLDPGDIARDSSLDRGLRFIADGADAGYIGDQRTNLAGAELASGNGFEGDPELIGDDGGQFTHAGSTATADIDRLPVEFVRGGCEQVGTGDVLDEAKVAGLAAIFIENGRLAIQQAGAEDGDDAGVGIEERLARPIGA